MPDVTDFAWIPDKESLQVFLNKNTKTTPQASKEISQTWSDAAKAKSFFSARVTSVEILEEMRKQIAFVVEGLGTKAQAKEWIRDFLDTKGDSALREMGFLPSEATKLAKGNKLSQLASATRINLIVSQNVDMALAAKRYNSIMSDPFATHIQYHTVEDSRVRNSHKLLDKMIFRKDDPAVRQIWPPQDFRCRCHVKSIDEEDLNPGDIVQNGLPPQWQPPESGYSFDPAEWQDTLPPINTNKIPPREALFIQQEVEQAIVDKVLPPVKPPVLPPMVNVTQPIKPKLRIKQPEKPAIQSEPDPLEILFNTPEEPSHPKDNTLEQPRAPFVVHPKPTQIIPSKVSKESAIEIKNPNNSYQIEPVVPMSKISAKTDLDKSIIDWLNEKNFSPVENLALLDSKGKRIIESSGNSGQATFKGDPYVIQGKELIHNHPAGWGADDSNPLSWGYSLSKKDINTMINTRLKSMIATTPKVMYKLTPKYEKSIADLEKEVKMVYDQARGEYEGVALRCEKMIRDEKDRAFLEVLQAWDSYASEDAICRSMALILGWKYERIEL